MNDKKKYIFIVIVFLFLISIYPKGMISKSSEINSSATGDKYALLFAGSCYKNSGGLTSEFSDSIQEWYKVLKYDYGYSDSKIHYLDTVFYNPNGKDFDSNPLNFEYVCSLLRAQVDSNDQVVVIWASHGDDPFNLWDSQESEFQVGHLEWKDDDYLAKQLKRIDCGIMYCILGACYSGGAIKELEESNRIIFTACKYEEMTNSYFINELGRSFGDDILHTIRGNKDGEWSLGEAIDYMDYLLPGPMGYYNPQASIGTQLYKYSSYL
ncbi:MAG: hypothetical protein JXA99_16170 [Candidatus Lokiarchaeota archaeon]|nr:hypothetical protein [Candidatus Lokiarchaeota archaeon]